MGSERAAGVLERLDAVAEESALDLLHQSLERFWSRLDPPADGRFEMLFTTAVAEIAANIVEHARPEGRDFRLELELSGYGDRVEAEFRDDGRPMARRLEARGLAEDSLEERGRGLPIVLAIVDELHYESDGGRNTWRLTKRRP